MTGFDLDDLWVIRRHAVNVPSIVGEKDENCVLSQTKFIQLGQDPAKALVHALEHGGHDGIALLAPRIGLFGKLFGVFFLVSPRAMNSVLPKVQKEGIAFVFFNEGDRFVGQSVGDIFSIRTIGNGASWTFRTGLGIQGYPVG